MAITTGNHSGASILSTSDHRPEMPVAVGSLEIAELVADVVEGYEDAGMARGLGDLPWTHGCRRYFRVFLSLQTQIFVADIQRIVGCPPEAHLRSANAGGDQLFRNHKESSGSLEASVVHQIQVTFRRRPTLQDQAHQEFEGRSKGDPHFPPQSGTTACSLSRS